jgi:hypothetical protein
MIVLFAFTFFISIVRSILSIKHLFARYPNLIFQAFGLSDIPFFHVCDILIYWGSWIYQLVFWTEYFNIL